MREVFVDTSFFVAILNPKDGLHQRAERVARSLGGVRLVTIDGVLTEVLNYLPNGAAASDAPLPRQPCGREPAPPQS